MRSLYSSIFFLVISISVAFGQIEEIEKICTDIPRQERTAVSIGEFTFSAQGGYDRSAGVGLRKMLSNALVECGCYRVVERAQLNTVMKGQELALTGAVRRGTGARTGQLSGEQITILADITEFKENEKSAGIGILSKFGLGGIGKTTAHIGLVVQMVEVETGEILISKSIDHKRSSIGVAGGTGIASVLAGGLFYKSKAMEDAIEEAIIEIVGVISSQEELLPEGNGDGHLVADQYGIGGGITVKPSECGLLRNSRKPTVMVVIPEVHIQRVIPDPAGETEIIRKLKSFGYEVLDPRQVELIRQQEGFNQALESEDTESLVNFGKQLEADIMIVGEAFSEDAMRLENMFSCRARVEARAIDVNSGAILATNGAHGSGLDIATNVAAKAALRDAGSLMADYFINELCNAQLSNLPSEGRRDLGILISNLSFTEYRKLTSSLESASWLSIVKKDFNKNIFKLIVRSDEETDEIANRLINLTGQKLKIVSASGNKIQAKFN